MRFGIYGNYNLNNTFELYAVTNYNYFSFEDYASFDEKLNYIFSVSNHMLSISFFCKLNLFKGLFLQFGPEFSIWRRNDSIWRRNDFCALTQM